MSSRMTYVSPVTGERVELLDNPVDHSFGIEPGDDVEADDLRAARGIIVGVLLSLPFWLLLVLWWCS
jgi:hypothetical protein